jgi:predicted site-specific integrase-resolvase
LSTIRWWGGRAVSSLCPQEEMVQDLPAIVHTFSCRLYGLRKYEKKLKGELGGRLGGGR